MGNNETEPDLNDIDYQEAPIPKSAQKLTKYGFKPIRGLWTINSKRRDSKSRLFFSKITSVIVNNFKKGVDFLKHMRYNSIQNISERIKVTMSKTTKNTEEKDNTKKEQTKSPFSWKKLWNGIMGVGQLFVAGSIIASTVIIWNGTDGLTPKIIIAPMAIYAVIILVSKFISNNKGNK